MKTITQNISLLVLLSCTSTNLFAETSDEWKLLPVFNDSQWKPDFALSATAGYMDIDGSVGSGGETYGMQLAFNCPVFTPPGEGVVLQQFDVNHYDNGNLELTTFEINPRYFVPVAEGLKIGVGPGIGYMWTDYNGGKDPNMWTAQLGVDVEYRKGSLYAGFGTRYQWTENETIGPNQNEGVDNLLTSIKVGINF